MRILACLLCLAGLSALDLGVAVTVRLLPPSGSSISTVRTLDQDADGHIDRLVVQFSAPVDIVDPGGATDGLPCLSVSGGYTLANVDYTGTGLASVTLLLVPGAVVDTDAVPTLTYSPSAGASISGLTDGEAVVATDTARPVASLDASVASVVTTPTVDISWTYSEPVTVLTAGGITVTNAAVTAVVQTGPASFTATVTPAMTGAFSVTLADGAVADPSGNLGRATTTLTPMWFPPAADSSVLVSSAVLHGQAPLGSVIRVEATTQPVPNGTWSATVALPGADPKRIVVPVQQVLPTTKAPLGHTVTIDISASAVGGGG